jgi:tetratricopeptide (TPR) repeat protein
MASDNDPVAPPSGQPDQAPAATGIQTEQVHGSATATQTAPTAPPPTEIPLPPSRPRPIVVSPEQLAVRLMRLDLLLVAVVVVLAFLLGSFVAHNSDVWMSLANGRLLAKGDYKFGVDPYSYTTKGVYWANHSWLFDLISYGVYQLTTDVGLGIFKALLGVILAGVMLASGRARRSLWIPAVCTAVALLALSQQLFLRSTVISFLFLGITLCLLHRTSSDDPELSASARKRKAPSLGDDRRRLWLLVPLFLLWVNMDSWFLLGPITVALYLVGDFLQENLGPDGGIDSLGAPGRRTAVLVLLAGTAVCLVNPHTYHAFVLPWQLGWSDASEVLKDERAFKPFFRGSVEYYQNRLGWSVVGVAYLVLVGMGLVSFAVNYRDWRWGRAAIWVAFAALSVYHQRAIPFFAVVAGPITALNFQDAVARNYGTALRVTRNWREWSTGGRVAALVCGLALVAVAWPGWLSASWSGIPGASRRVAWGVYADPSLTDTAARLKEWRETGVLGKNDHGLNLSPDLANYCAWFCPEQQGFIDHRLSLYGGVADSYKKLRKGFAFEELAPDRISMPKDSPVPDILRQYGINHVVFSFDNPILASKPMTYLLNDPAEQWRLVDSPLRTLIFSWKDPKAKEPALPLKGLRFDPDKMAFGPEPMAAPGTRPAAPEARPWWEQFVHAGGEPSKHLHAAMMNLIYLESLASRDQLKWRRESLKVTAVGLIASPSLASGSLFRTLVAGSQFLLAQGRPLQGALPFSTQLAQAFTQNHLARFDDGPASAAWLAVRHCRLALAENPDDPKVYMQLQLAYLRLQTHTHERTFGNFPMLSLIRRVQRVYALTNAILLDPDLEGAHGELAVIYLQSGYLDLALKHFKEQLRLSLKRGVLLGEDPEKYEQRIADLDDYVKNLDAEVKKKQNEYEVAQVGRIAIRHKAELAQRLGLGGQALEMLMKSDDVVLDREAIQLQLQLMLMTGHIEGKDGIRDTLSEENLSKMLGRAEMGRFSYPAYNWLQVLTAAACGDYQEADAKLSPLLDMRELEQKQFATMMARETSLQMISFEIATPHQLPARVWWNVKRASFLLELERGRDRPPLKADIFILRGLLALEEGRNAHAKKMFTQAIGSGAPDLEPMARYYLKLLEVNGS